MGKNLFSSRILSNTLHYAKSSINIYNDIYTAIINDIYNNIYNYINDRFCPAEGLWFPGWLTEEFIFKVLYYTSVYKKPKLVIQAVTVRSIPEPVLWLKNLLCTSLMQDCFKETWDPADRLSLLDSTYKSLERFNITEVGYVTVFSISLVFCAYSLRIFFFRNTAQISLSCWHSLGQRSHASLMLSLRASCRGNSAVLAVTLASLLPRRGLWNTCCNWFLYAFFYPRLS